MCMTSECDKKYFETEEYYAKYDHSRISICSPACARASMARS